MALLFPRLSPVDAVELWESYKDCSINELRGRSQTSHPGETFAAVGGRRVTPHKLEQIATQIRGIAKSHGYPDRGIRKSLADFDTELSIYLGSELEIPLGEAYRAETWAFLSLVLLPDIVKWRFTNFNAARCTGGRRDCFHRLWLRACAFDLGKESENRWVILNHLTEDTFVSIIERPSLAGNTELCRVLGLAWMEAAGKVGRSRMEDINRRAIKRIRAKGTIIFLDALSYNELKQLVGQCYAAETAA